jgi:putative hemolysin
MSELRAGGLEVRLADSPTFVDAAQALRYRIFYEEMAAKPSPEMAERRRDFDEFDPACDHLLVVDHTRGSGPESVVGTYRLLRRAAALRHGGFYSAREYDIAPLLAFPGEIMEVGRSCVDAAYRTGTTMQLLWQGIAAYVMEHEITMMFGCASLPGTDPKALAVPLSYLYHFHLAPPAIRPRALPHLYVDMNLLPREKIDPRRGLGKLPPLASGMGRLPPLIKGYLRLGGFVGDGAVIDYQFNTTDVCVMVETRRVTEKYFRHYERGAREVRTEP